MGIRFNQKGTWVAKIGRSGGLKEEMEMKSNPRTIFRSTAFGLLAILALMVQGQITNEREAVEREYLKRRMLLLDGSFQKMADRWARREAVSGVRADYNTEPRYSDDPAAAASVPAATRVDVPRLIRHCDDLGGNCYHFLIWHQKTDWEDFQAFVVAAEKSRALEARKFTTWVYLVPPSESRTARSEPFGTDYIAWMENVARFSAAHPMVKAVCIDDFYWSPENRALFTREYLQKMRTAADQYNPRLALVTVMYWDEIDSRRQLETLKEATVIGDEIDGILYPYMGQSLGKGLSHRETSALPAEIKRLRDIYPGVPVIVDIYVTKHSQSPDRPNPRWVGELLDLARVHADGVALYGMPKKNKNGTFAESWCPSMQDPAGILETVRNR
jgi:hypothetical protein